MILLKVIQLFIDENITTIRKFDLFKLFKKIYQDDFTYYKCNLMLNRLLKTNVLIKEKNNFIFNKEQNEKQAKNRFIITFD